jgi:hypothetical protein
MASNIVPGNIDGTYPVAGQDNSSQGFRDNFRAIKNNFTEAASEITNLQTNKASLNSSSNFADNIVSRAQLKDISETVYPHGNITGSVIINHENGHYQTATTTGPITIGFSNFPTSGQLGRIILDINITSTAHTITIPIAVIVADNVTGGDGSSDLITVTNSGRVLYEFMTPDGGTTVLMHQLGKLYT